MDWKDSVRTCESYGGHLAIINSDEEYKAFDKQFAGLAKLEEGACSNYQAVWLGIANVNFNKTLEVEEDTNSLFALVNYRTGEEITWEVPWAPDHAADDYWKLLIKLGPVLVLDFVMLHLLQHFKKH